MFTDCVNYQQVIGTARQGLNVLIIEHCEGINVYVRPPARVAVYAESEPLSACVCVMKVREQEGCPSANYDPHIQMHPNK